MGFNRRHVTLPSILNCYASGGTEEVINYVTKPDALTLSVNDVMLRQIVNHCMKADHDELEKLLKSYIYNK